MKKIEFTVTAYFDDEASLDDLSRKNTEIIHSFLDILPDQQVEGNEYRYEAPFPKEVVADSDTLSYTWMSISDE